MTAAAIQHCCRLQFWPRPRRRGQTREAEAKRHEAEAEAKARTHEAEVKAEAVNFDLEAEARPRGLTSLPKGRAIVKQMTQHLKISHQVGSVGISRCLCHI